MIRLSLFSFVAAITPSAIAITASVLLLVLHTWDTTTTVVVAFQPARTLLYPSIARTTTPPPSIEPNRSCIYTGTTTTTTKRKMIQSTTLFVPTTKMDSAFSSTTTTSTQVHLSSDDWSSFSALDDDDEIVTGQKTIDRTVYATEDDTNEIKASVGATLLPPEIEQDAEPIQVPAGSQLELSEETVLGVLSACRNELGTLFGYTAENRGVGITGGVDYVDMDGPNVVIKLKGRFWHQRTTVLERVANYLQQRIPEIVEVTVEDPWQLTDEANRV